MTLLKIQDMDFQDSQYWAVFVRRIIGMLSVTTQAKCKVKIFLSELIKKWAGVYFGKLSSTSQFNKIMIFIKRWSGIVYLNVSSNILILNFL